MSVSGTDWREDDHGLHRLDILGDLDDLRSAAERSIASLDVDARPGANQLGTDASNSVWATVNPSGAVLDVSISRNWFKRLPAERLGEAILEAYRQAQEKCGAARVLATMRQGDVDNADTLSVEPYDPGMPDIQDSRWLGWVWQSLDEAGLRADQLFSRPSQEATGERTVAGPRGYVRLRVTGSQVTAVLVDAPGVAERDPDAVAVDARAGFESVRVSSR